MSDTFDPSAPGTGDGPDDEKIESEEAMADEVIELTQDAVIEAAAEEVADEVLEEVIADAIIDAAAEEMVEDAIEEAEGGEVGATADDLADAELLDVEEVTPSRAEPSPFDRSGRWYVVHTYAGYENKVKQNLASRVRSMAVEDRIFEVVIPMEDVIEFKNGRKVVVQKKVFPGYLLVRMGLDDDAWYVVRNTPGVTGFVGSGAKPTPLSRKEVEDILGTGEKEEGGTRSRRRCAPGSSTRSASRCVWSPARSPTSTVSSARSTSTVRSSRCS